MVKVTFLTVVLLDLCESTTAWFGGGGRSSSSSSRSKGNSGSNDGKDKEKGTSVDVNVETSNDGGSRVSTSINHQGDGWSAGVDAGVNDKGDWEVKTGVSFEVQKRSVDWNGRHYTVRLDPCNFEVYDVHKDGVIIKSEVMAIFGENTKADKLFEALDLTTGDGQIEEEEFYFMSALTIDGCQSRE